MTKQPLHWLSRPEQALVRFSGLGHIGSMILDPKAGYEAALLPVDVRTKFVQKPRANSKTFRFVLGHSLQLCVTTQSSVLPKLDISGLGRETSRSAIGSVTEKPQNLLLVPGSLIGSFDETTIWHLSGCEALYTAEIRLSFVVERKLSTPRCCIRLLARPSQKTSLNDFERQHWASPQPFEDYSSPGRRRSGHGLFHFSARLARNKRIATKMSTSGNGNFTTM